MVTQIINMVLGNSIVIVPLAIVVTLASRWVTRPAAIHLLWLIVLVKLVCPSVIEVPLAAGPKFAYPVASFSEATGIERVSAAVSTGESPDNLRGHTTRNPMTADQGVSSTSVANFVMSVDSTQWSRAAAVIWGLGSAIFFCMIVCRARRFHRFVRRAPLANESIQTTVRSIATRYGLRASPVIRVAAGNFPPLLWVFPGSASIVLPQRLISQLDVDATKNLLAHELAHYARGDHWVRLFESIVLGVYWWHPMAWYARRQLQHAEEQCCDAWVLWAFPKSNTEYARTLLATMDYLSGVPSALPPLASGLDKTNLIRRRFEMILHHKSPRKLSMMGIATTAAVAMAILPWSASIFAQPQDSAGAAVDAEFHEDNQDVVEDAQPTQNATNVSENKLSSEEMHRLIRIAIHRALRGVQGELDQAKEHIADEIRHEVARSLEDIPHGNWMRVMTKTLAELDEIPEEDIKAIAEHIQSAMEHVGKAVDRSAKVLSHRIDESDAIDGSSSEQSPNLSDDK